MGYLQNQLKRLPDKPGIYFFKSRGRVLYIGKATSVRERVRSYFGNDRLATERGPKIASMIPLVTRIEYRQTDSVLEALLVETELIKKYQPPYNTAAKDDKSFYYLVITKEGWPRILLKRGSELGSSTDNEIFSLYPSADERHRTRNFIARLTPRAFLDIVGPFPNGREVRAAMKILRRLFPWRDNDCEPGSGTPCFNYQIGLCPGTCVGAISRRDYHRLLRQLRLFLHGEKRRVIKSLEQEMKSLARAQKFEQAGIVKRRLFALKHVQDVALITDRWAEGGAFDFRIEAYDIAHLTGGGAVGAMAVWQGGDKCSSEYRHFRLQRTKPGDDHGGLREILERRLRHPEWPRPDLIAVDGGAAQLRVAARVVERGGFKIPLVAVTKDEHHRPKQIIGDQRFIHRYERAIVLANREAHRFAITYHRKLRTISPT